MKTNREHSGCVSRCFQLGELTHSLTAALDQLRVVASSTSNDPGPRSRQHQQIGQRRTVDLKARRVEVNQGLDLDLRLENLVITGAWEERQIRKEFTNGSWRLRQTTLILSRCF